MASFLQNSKERETMDTRSTFYQKHTIEQKPNSKFSQTGGFIENSFSGTQQSHFLSQTIRTFRPKSKQTTLSTQTKLSSTMEKIKSLSIRLNFENKFNVFMPEKDSKKVSKTLTMFLKSPEWYSKIELSKKDQILKRLLTTQDFSIRTFSWYLSANFKEAFLKRDEVP